MIVLGYIYIKRFSWQAQEGAKKDDDVPMTVREDSVPEPPSGPPPDHEVPPASTAGTNQTSNKAAAEGDKDENKDGAAVPDPVGEVKAGYI